MNVLLQIMSMTAAIRIFQIPILYGNTVYKKYVDDDIINVCGVKKS